jgi:SAM-dependent methyltransferase
VAPTDRPDELALAGREHLDPAYVEGYDAKAAFDPAGDLAELRELGLDAEATLVDLGAGTGTFALAAAAVCRRVVAVDVSPPMVAALRSRAAGLENVEVVEAGFLTYRHMGAPAHFVYTRNALHHLPDAWKAEREEHVRHEFSTFSWLLGEMLARAGFTVERAEFRSRIYADYVCRVTARPAPARRPASPGA